MLNISLVDVICVVVNLFVLYLILRKVLFGRVTAIIELRQEELATTFATAEEKQQKAAALLSQYEQQLSQADRQTQSLLAAAKARSEQEYTKTMQRAKEDSEALIASTQTQLEAERNEMMAGVRSEVATLALLAAAKVSGRGLDEDADAAFVDAFLAQVGDAP